MGLWNFGMEISPDGNYFTYSRGDVVLPVWSIGDERNPDPSKWARTENGRPTDIALSRGAKRMATAVEGTIVVSETTDTEKQVPELKTINGTGKSMPGSLHFVGQEALISASGDDIRIWAVSASDTFRETTSADLPMSCIACGPPSVNVNPSGSAAAIVADDGEELLVVDFTTGRSKTVHDLPGEDWSTLERNVTAASWLDDERLLVMSAFHRRAWVLQGNLLGEVESSWAWTDIDSEVAGEGQGQASEDRAREWTRMTMAPDGRLHLGNGTTLYTIDPNKQDVTRHDYPGGVPSPDGTITILMEPSDEATPSVRLATMDTKTHEITYDQVVPGTFSRVTGTESTLTLWRAQHPDDETAKLVRLTIPDGSSTTLGSVPNPTFNWVDGTGVAAKEKNGKVTLTNLEGGSSILVAKVPIGTRQWTSMRFSMDGGALVLGNEPSRSASVLPASADHWSQMACDLAGDISDEDWQSITGRSDPQRPTCAGPVEANR